MILNMSFKDILSIIDMNLELYLLILEKILLL